MRQLTAVLVLGATLGWLGVAAEPRWADHRPMWSRDGRSLFFMSNRDGDWEMYRWVPGTRTLTRLTHHAGWDGYADPSPDGRLLAFDRRGEGGARMVVLDLDRGTVDELVALTDGGGPRWSPDGSTIVYADVADGTARDVVLISPAGGALRQVTRTPETETDPVFSPDGRWLAVAVWLKEGSALDVLRIDGTGRRRVTTTTGRLYGPAWSPDGRVLTFNTDEDGDQEIFRIGVDGEGRRQLTNHAAIDHQAVWGPDGRLTFTSYRSGAERIYTMNAEGGDVREIEMHPERR